MIQYSILLKSSYKDIANKTRRWKSTVRKIEKLLVANRGEIACRVMRTAQRLGVRTVAIYSEADENSLHVALADEAYKIGPPPAAQSYLRGDKILEVAKNSHCHAIHPGYGFLSENVEFAESCLKNDVIFIGPPASAIRDMGIKSTSKAIMSSAGVPIIGGYHGEDQSPERLLAESRRIGYPVMIKAVRGGGGKGMRIAMNGEEFLEALESAKRESLKAFGDDVVLVERFVAEPRHVEVQVFADTYGNAVHLFERDCSVQRRHQKIIEEAPAPGISEEVRQNLGAAAVRAAKAVGYVGAGTVEFILDRKTHDFFFMEMNTRLQVEHPVTEMITGTDLVEWQIKVASGEKLPLTQEELKPKGHAFEARIYAEDPKGDFMPGAGPLLHLSTPAASDDVRIETGVREGDEVSVHYDPMIAKLVTWGSDRSEALTKLRARLTEYNIAGLETNVNFLLELTKHDEFLLGNVHTNFIRDHGKELFREITPRETQLIQSALYIILKDRQLEEIEARRKRDNFNPFVVESCFRINYNHRRNVKVCHDGKEYMVEVEFVDKNEYKVKAQGSNVWRTVKGNLERTENHLRLHSFIDGAKYVVKVYSNDNFIAIFDQEGKIQFELPQPKFLTEETGDTAGLVSSNKAVSPMPGILDKILVRSGDTVKKGDSLFVLIAMKMEHVVKATGDAVVANVFFKPGDKVQKDTVIVQFEEHKSEEKQLND